MPTEVCQREAGDGGMPLDLTSLHHFLQMQTYVIPGPLDALVRLCQPHLGLLLGLFYGLFLIRACFILHQ